MKLKKYLIISFFIIQNCCTPDVVINIGSDEDDYLYIIGRKVGKSGKIIVFDSRQKLFQQLVHLKKILKWNNIEVEPLAVETLDSYCLAGAQNILETFTYLLQVGNKGYFVVDTIKIPAENFDFNLYQNMCNNFYSNNFMFEECLLQKTRWYCI